MVYADGRFDRFQVFDYVSHSLLLQAEDPESYQILLVT